MIFKAAPAFNLLDLFPIAVMAGWLAISALCQIPSSLSRRLRAWDIAGLIPLWPFFAPVPGTSDYYLLYRDSLTDGTIESWREISLCDDRRLWHLIWNPRKREKKALFDLTTALLSEATPNLTQGIQLSVPYLALLTYISSLPRVHGARSTQFLLMISGQVSGGAAPTPLFTSAVHPL